MPRAILNKFGMMASKTTTRVVRGSLIAPMLVGAAVLLAGVAPVSAHGHDKPHPQLARRAAAAKSVGNFTTKARPAASTPAPTKPSQGVQRTPPTPPAPRTPPAPPTPPTPPVPPALPAPPAPPLATNAQPPNRTQNAAAKSQFVVHVQPLPENQQEVAAVASLNAPVDSVLVAPAYADVFGPIVEQLRGVTGDPVESEHSNGPSCDVSQRTTAGVVYWSCETGLVGFAAAPDGLQHWAWTGTDILHWTGPAAEPPTDAAVVDSATIGAAAEARRAANNCAPSGDGVLGLCLFPDGAQVQDRITEQDGLVAYRFNLESTARVVADLTDLPADYDLYLANPAGETLGESVNEDTTAEHVSLNLAAGTYYIYVHVDAARAIDPATPYTLRVGLAVPIVAAPLDQVSAALSHEDDDDSPLTPVSGD